MECFSFESGCVVRVVKRLKVNWLVVAVTIAAQKQVYTVFINFTANVLKCKAYVCKSKILIQCITMCSLVMSPFSRDITKWK